MSSRYIRFFISSTFADMGRERNILRRLFGKLQTEYQARGWNIEYTDLRWGISREAALDNRTMRICLEELRHCRELSPRPNFIVLQGERYGWVPLPEVIPQNHIDPQEFRWLSPQQKRIFNQWYRLDENFADQPRYLLQPREWTFVDDNIFRDKAEKPLRAILSRILREDAKEILSVSATEQEIRAGLFCDPANFPHTLIYKRTLKDVPPSAAPLFQEQESRPRERMESLRRRLDSLRHFGNTFDTSLFFQGYDSGEYDRYLENHFSILLRKIIDRRIAEAEAEAPAGENGRHLEIARRRRGRFYGREAYITALLSRLTDDSHRPILLRGESGSGKSALMAELANRLEALGHNVILRFCGETPLSSTAIELLDSILRDLHLRSTKSDRRPLHIRRTDDGFFGSGISPWDALTTYRPSQPLFILIDAVNQTAPGIYTGFQNLKWLDVRLPDNLHVIVTTTTDGHLPDLSGVDVESLPGIDDDALTMVVDLLKEEGRRLTDGQLSGLLTLLAKSDRSAIYLRVLAGYLAGLPSWEELQAFPAGLFPLLDYLLDRLQQPSHHGVLLPRKALGLILADRHGLTDEELNALLSADREMMEAIRDNSFHDLRQAGVEGIPPVYWSRLKYDLGTLLRVFHSPTGPVNTFAHSKIREYVHTRLPESEKAGFHLALYDFLRPRINAGNRHAVYESARTLLEGVCRRFNCWKMAREAGQNPDSDMYAAPLAELERLLTSDADYILTKRCLFPDGLLDDYSEAIDRLAIPHLKNRLLALSREVSQLPLEGSPRDLRRWLLNVPERWELRRMILPDGLSGDILRDLWRDNRPELPVVFPVGKTGEFPALSSDGERIAYVEDFGHRVITENLTGNDRSYSLRARIRSFLADRTLRYHLAALDGEGFLYDSEAKETLVDFEFTGSPRIAITPDGVWSMFESDNEILIFNRLSGEYGNYENVSDGHLTASGRWLWCFRHKEGKRIIHRINLVDHTSLSFGIAPEGVSICYASDEICILRLSEELLFVRHFRENGKDRYKGAPFYLPSYESVRHIIPIDEIRFHILTSTGCWYTACFREDSLQSTNRGLLPELLAVCGDYALTEDAVVSLPQLMSLPYVREAFNNGINSLSADFGGEYCTVGFGVNSLQEQIPYIQLMTDSGTERFEPDWQNSGGCMVTSAAVSPDGAYLGFCNQWGMLSLCETGEERRTVSVTRPGDSNCIGLTFSENSAYLLAVDGDFIADPPAFIHLVDTIYGEAFTPPGQPDYNDRSDPEIWGYAPGQKGFVRLSRDNRYVYMPGYFLWDLIGERSLPTRDIPYAESSMPLKTSWQISRAEWVHIIEHPARPELWSAAKGVLTVVSLADGSTRSMPEPDELTGISADGSRLFFRDKENRLFIREYATGRTIPVPEKMIMVYPAPDPRYFFLYTVSRYVQLYDTVGRMLGEAFFPELWDARPTARGLVCADRRGKAALFAYPPEIAAGLEGCISFIRRWDVRRKELSRHATGVCPFCGTVISETSPLVKPEFRCPVCLHPLRKI